MQYRRGKKGETHWIGSALRQDEVKTLQQSNYTMWWFCGSLRIRWRHAPQQIAVPFAVCIFGGFVFCSVSRRKTKPCIIWPYHSFISYSILQLILKPTLYLLIYLTSLYFWWWRPPMGGGVCKSHCRDYWYTFSLTYNHNSNWVWLVKLSFEKSLP